MNDFQAVQGLLDALLAWHGSREADVARANEMAARAEALVTHLAEGNPEIADMVDRYRKIMSCRETIPFDNGTLFTVLEAASVALEDGRVFDHVAEELGLDDKELATIYDELHAYLEGDDANL